MYMYAWVLHSTLICYRFFFSGRRIEIQATDVYTYVRIISTNAALLGLPDQITMEGDTTIVSERDTQGDRTISADGCTAGQPEGDSLASGILCVHC